MLKVAIIGKTGRMGQEVAKLCDVSSFDECVVAIDFSSQGALERFLPELIAKKIPLVSGTTALPETFFDEAAKTIPILHASNFSLGVALLKKMVEQIAPHAKTITINETHHTEKKDSPSGTALDLLSLADGATITSHRVPGAVGIHEVTFSLGNETLTLTHTALDRKLFAEGAIKAALWLCGKPPGRYNLSEVL